MKTSIIVSSTAALCLLITLAETPENYSAENNNTSMVGSFTYIPSNLGFTVSAESISAEKKEYADVKTNVKLVEDFNYLKFDVADYKDNNEMEAEVTTEISLGYLKFDVNKYTENAELTSLDAIEMPVNEYAYLKFDVNAANDELTDFDALELPVNEFEYLKFDIRKYASQLTHTSDNFGQIPIN